MFSIARYYDYIFNDLADIRVKNWPLMSGPGPMTTIMITYLLTIYIILPAYMKNRKPYSLRTFIYYYNLFQIGACVVLMYGIITSGWTTHYTMGCQVIDYSTDPMALRMLKYVYLTYWLKLIELVETFVFILRKKDNQVSKLHVYHHTTTASLAWVATKYFGGGMTTFPIILNCSIHVLMYSYYFLSALGPEWQKILAKWKPKLTIAQMIQFGIMVVHSTQAIKPSCPIPRMFAVMYLPNILVLSNMFYNFFKASYMKKIQ